MEVQLVHWPDDVGRLDELRDGGLLRLLLVDPVAPPPTVHGIEEDWIRLPASKEDVRSRISGLLDRVEMHRPVVPAVEGAVLRFGDKSVALRPMEETLISALLREPWQVMSRPALFEAGWPGRPVDRNLLDAQLVHIRRRFDDVGLQLRTIRSRGVLVEW